MATRPEATKAIRQRKMGDRRSRRFDASPRLLPGDVWRSGVPLWGQHRRRGGRLDAVGGADGCTTCPVVKST